MNQAIHAVATAQRPLVTRPIMPADNTQYVLQFINDG